MAIPLSDIVPHAGDAKHLQVYSAIAFAAAEGMTSWCSGRRGCKRGQRGSISERYYCGKCTPTTGETTLTNPCTETRQACREDIPTKALTETPRGSCYIKRRGCGSSNIYHQHCQSTNPYVCKQTILMRKVAHFMVHCGTKKDYVGNRPPFRDTHKGMVNKQIPKTKHAPTSSSPSQRCSTDNRVDTEDHEKICSPEKVQQPVCNEGFLQEDELNVQKVRKDSSLPATAEGTAKVGEQEQNFDREGNVLVQDQEVQDQELQEDDNKSREQDQEQDHVLQELQEHMLHQQIQDQAQDLAELQKAICKQDEKILTFQQQITDAFQDQKHRLAELEQEHQKLCRLGQDQTKVLKQVVQDHGEKISNIQQQVDDAFQLHKTSSMELQYRIKGIEVLLQQFSESEKNFVIRNFCKRRSKWRSPTMYSCNGGFKFCVEVVPTTNFLKFYLSTQKGIFDQQLKWPLHVIFTLKVLNQSGGEDWKGIFAGNIGDHILYEVTSLPFADVEHYLQNDAMHIVVPKIKH